MERELDFDEIWGPITSSFPVHVIRGYLQPGRWLGPERQVARPSQDPGRKDCSYPKIAEDIRLEGIVRVKITVAPDGTVAKTELVRGSPVFVGPTLEAIKSMKRQPAAEETIELVEIEFRLRQN